MFHSNFFVQPQNFCTSLSEKRKHNKSLSQFSETIFSGSTPTIFFGTKKKELKTNPKMRTGFNHLVKASSFNNNSNLNNTTQINLIRRYFIIGERRISNYLWASIILIGGIGFLLTGISAYFQFNILNSTSTFLISFFPHGLLMCFYGSLAILLSIYWWLLIYWDIGGGFNEFNKKEGFLRIFRWGYPGKNRRIDLIYLLKDIETIRVELKQNQGLFSSDQTIYVKLRKNLTLLDQTKSKGLNQKETFEIPLGGIGQPLTLKEIEKQASELANYLQVALEGL